jgi:hypothetical protein
MKEEKSSSLPLCPSAQPEMEGSVVFGIIGGTVEQPQVGYLAATQPVTDELLALSQPVKPTEVFRFAAPCAESACQHFDGLRCKLAVKVVQMLPVVVDRLPPCSIRPNCRWWQQEGKAACARCPALITEMYQPTDQQRQAADPTT